MDYVGFSKLPSQVTTNTATIITQCNVLILSQVHRRALAQGFQFNLLVLGEAGLGKSSLVNSMLWCEVWSWKHTKIFTITEKALVGSFSVIVQLQTLRWFV